jgi:hypothetical protein
VEQDGFIAIARRVMFRIRKNRSLTSAGSYVLMDGAGRVFVLSEGSATTEPQVDKHIRWLVGRYASGDKCVFPSMEDLLEDLMERSNS